MANFHDIKARLYNNVLTENPNDFIARVISEGSLNVRVDLERQGRHKSQRGRFELKIRI